MKLGHKKIGRRDFWLSYGVDIVCPGCNFCIIRIEEVWCGCRPVPRKLKKWLKGRKAAYQDGYQVYGT